MVVLLALRRGAKRTCAHCGRADLGGPDVSRGVFGQLFLCRPRRPGIMNCLGLVADYQHATPCRVCAAAFPSAFVDCCFPVAGPHDATVWSHRGRETTDHHPV